MLVVCWLRVGCPSVGRWLVLGLGIGVRFAWLRLAVGRWLVGRPSGRSVGMFVCVLVGWLVGWLAGWLAGWLVGWFGWLAGWLVSWLAG